MSTFRNFTARLRLDVRGANLVEYIMLVGVVALIALAGFVSFGAATNNKITEHGHKINQIGDN